MHPTHTNTFSLFGYACSKRKDSSAKVSDKGTRE